MINSVSDELKKLNSQYVIDTWNKSLERKFVNLEGAITIAKTLMETVFKHILDELNINYGNKADLPELYKLVADNLSLSPHQHQEQIFKQILGSCSGVVSGLGSLRNSYGDAHGKGKKNYRPSARHAELAINISGSMCLFIMQTYENKKSLDIEMNSSL
ncbi:abortive infection family protein [Tepidibacter mesophilus]|uniref:abortive infection family protein n=1 Tax=Tepidibacter mesophilus TaxID=655607 RepID=UPI001A9A3771|nr:abortive infection family protein [Tepidibacter mesophilus]